MMLPVTEQLLWDIYKNLQNFTDLYRSLAPRNLKDLLCPEAREMRRKYEKIRSERQFRQLLYYLKRKGWIQMTPETERLLPTRMGVERALRIKWKLASEKQRNDGKCIMVMYDVPEKQKRVREFFRRSLSVLGYRKYQQSVWISKRDVHRETLELIDVSNVGKNAKVFIVKEVVL